MKNLKREIKFEMLGVVRTIIPPFFRSFRQSSRYFQGFCRCSIISNARMRSYLSGNLSAWDSLVKIKFNLSVHISFQLTGIDIAGVNHHTKINKALGEGTLSASEIENVNFSFRKGFIISKISECSLYAAISGIPL